MVRAMKPEELKKIRRDLKLTQQELADTLEVERNTVARWETGTVVISKVVELAVKSLAHCNAGKAPPM